MRRRNMAWPIETGAFPATSATARVLGAEPLEPETSTNASIGAVIRLGAFDLTIDAYRIEIEDQIVLSENITRTFSPQVAALLDPLGIQAARFFVFDAYPDFTPARLNANGVLGFPFYSPFGFNGRFGYARLSLSW